MLVAELERQRVEKEEERKWWMRQREEERKWTNWAAGVERTAGEEERGWMGVDARRTAGEGQRTQGGVQRFAGGERLRETTASD